MDTSSLASVRSFAETYLATNGHETPIDILFMNAGTNYAPPPEADYFCNPKTEADGIDSMFQVNYLGHHLMYQLLEPAIKRSQKARIVQTSSASSFQSFSYKVATDLKTLHGCSEQYFDPASFVSFAYGQSKLAQILWVKKLTRSLNQTADTTGANGNGNIVANAFHPGLVATPIAGKIMETSRMGGTQRKFFETMMGIAWQSPDGALSGLYLAAKDGIQGRFFHPQAREVINPDSLDEKMQDDLWKFSDELVQNYLSPIEPLES